jgi:hypothetical protein
MSNHGISEIDLWLTGYQTFVHQVGNTALTHLDKPCEILRPLNTEDGIREDCKGTRDGGVGSNNTATPTGQASDLEKDFFSRCHRPPGLIHHSEMGG